MLVLSYNPDLDSDPFGEEGSLWSFNYFFYNKKLKRIVFFTCRSVRSAQRRSAFLYYWYVIQLSTSSWSIKCFTDRWLCMNLSHLQCPEWIWPWLSRQWAGHGAGWRGGDGWIHWGQVRLLIILDFSRIYTFKRVWMCHLLQIAAFFEWHIFIGCIIKIHIIIFLFLLQVPQSSLCVKFLHGHASAKEYKGFSPLLASCIIFCFLILLPIPKPPHILVHVLKLSPLLAMNFIPQGGGHFAKTPR